MAQALLANLLASARANKLAWRRASSSCTHAPVDAPHDHSCALRQQPPEFFSPRLPMPRSVGLPAGAVLPGDEPHRDGKLACRAELLRIAEFCH